MGLIRCVAHISFAIRIQNKIDGVKWCLRRPGVSFLLSVSNLAGFRFPFFILVSCQICLIDLKRIYHGFSNGFGLILDHI